MADKDAAAAAAMAPTQQQPAINDATIPIAQVVVAGAAQNISQALPTVAATPMRQLQFSADQGSAVSSITDGPPSAAANTMPPPANNNYKRAATSTMPPPPKRHHPDFTKPHNDDKSFNSGDDSNGWIVEEDKVMGMVINGINAEEDEADNCDDDKMKQITEMDYLIDDEEEGNPDNLQQEKIYETIQVTPTSHGNAQLKEMCRATNLIVSGNKKALFERIRDSGNVLVKKVNDDLFEFQKEVTSGMKGLPTWVLLNPQVAPTIEGINMETGAQRGFHNPTNPENVSAATKHNYLTSEVDRIKRPQFSYHSKKSPPSTTAQPSTSTAQSNTHNNTTPPGSSAHDNNTTPPEPEPTPSPPERGGPSPEAKDKIGDLRKARPKDFFDLIITPEFIEKTLVACTNARAAADGAGSQMYEDFMPFSVEEANKMIGLLFANGLTPKPAMELWFLTKRESLLFGNDFISYYLDKVNPSTGKKIKGLRRWKHWRRYMCCYDFRVDAKAETAKNPLFKVQLLLDEINRQSKKMWTTGKWVSIDEQTLGFKGRSGMKLRISYKKEGDGFQCDAVCENGYTFAFWFRHGDAPTLPDEYKHLNLSPTSRRVVWLALQLSNKWTRIFMDNLFNSRRLFTALYIAEALAHGVVRTSNRGMPPEIRQQEEKNEKQAELLYGTTKAAKLVNDPECPDLLAVSVYDTKPVHLMTTVEEDIHWVEKKRKVWSAVHKDIQLIGFLRLNWIDDYNNNMNSTDIADQLRNVYRPDHWLRNRKWWWAFFIWGVGVAGVNAWKIYEEMYAEAEADGKPLPPKWSHCEFLEQLVYDLICPNASRDIVNLFSGMDDETFASEVRTTRSMSSFGTLGASTDMNEDVDLTCDSGIKDYCDNNKPESMTKPRMEGGYFSRRLDGRMHGSVPSVGDSSCQYCRYQYKHMISEEEQKTSGWMKQNRTQTMRCLVCNVDLCPRCNMEFHGFDMANTAQLMGKDR